VPRELSLSEIFQLGYYWETKILLTAIKLDLFSALDNRPATSPELANRLNLNTRALSLLLNALVAMRALNKQEEAYANTVAAQKHLVKSSPEYVGHLLILHDSEWDNWGKLEHTIRSGTSPVHHHVFETDPEMGAHVLAVLNRIGRGSGLNMAKYLQLHHVEHMIDIGGGAGTNAIACCQEYPHLRATVFDLPQTQHLTEHYVKEAGLEGRIALMPGNFNSDALGGPYDLALMSDILHYQDHSTNAALVHKVFAHLTGKGRLVIKDRFLDPERTSPAWTTAFAVHIMINTEHGDCFTTQEAMDWMRKAGFQSVSELEPRAIVQGVKA